MYKAYMSNGFILESESVRAVYKQADRFRRENVFTCNGRLGYRLYNPDGKMLMEVKAGEDVTLDETDVSVRLYNVVRRTLTTKGLIEKGHDVTLGELRRLVIDGHLRKARNAGTKTYAELFQMLEDYTGWDKELRLALENYMSDMPMGLRWLNAHCPGWGLYQ